MKKTYVNPTMEIVKVVSRLQLLAGSEAMGANGDFGSGEGITLGGRPDDGDDDW